MSKILVHSLTRLGDLIQSIPFFRRLRKRTPAAEIHLLIEESFAEVARLLPEIDRIKTLRLGDLLPPVAGDHRGDLATATRTYSDLIQSLRVEQYDEVWNLTHTRPATALSFLLAREKGCGVTLDRHGLQLVNSPWLRYFYATNLARPWCQFNLVDIYANSITGVPWDEGRRIEIDRSAYAQAEIPELGEPSQRQMVALHPGASQKTKQWPIDCFGEVAAHLSRRGDGVVIVIGHHRDRDLGDVFRGLPRVIDLIGKTSPRQLAAVLSLSRLLITNDSGPMHVAAGVGCRVLAVTVGTALGSETAPYGENHIVVEPDYPCFPCHPETPCSDPVCAKRVRPEFVISLVDDMLGTTAGAFRAVKSLDCRIYQTRRSPQDGLLRLDRLFAVEDDRDVLSEQARALWLSLLEPQRFRSCAPFQWVLPEIQQAASAALPVAREARQLASALAETTTNAGALRDIRELGNRLQRCDSELASWLSQHGLLVSFLKYAWIAKGSLQGATLREQALESATIYAQLVFVLTAWATGRRAGESEVNRQSIHTKENHENHAERPRAAATRPRISDLSASHR